MDIRHILLVDDDDDGIFLLRAIFEDLYGDSISIRAVSIIQSLPDRIYWLGVISPFVRLHRAKQLSFLLGY